MSSNTEHEGISHLLLQCCLDDLAGRCSGSNDMSIVDSDPPALIVREFLGQLLVNDWPLPRLWHVAVSFAYFFTVRERIDLAARVGDPWFGVVR